MLDEKMIEKMFENAWQSCGYFPSKKCDSYSVKDFKQGFKAAINLLLPIIQKQDEAISFYGDRAKWFVVENYIGEKVSGLISICDIDYDEDKNEQGGRLARSTKQEVSEMIKRLGGEG